MDKNIAIQLVTKYINEHYGSEEELAIAQKGVIEKEYGWIFFYNTKKYLETEEISYALAGNGPLLIEKTDGKITAFGTNKPVEEFIKDFEKVRRHTK